jgi:hypothetical protein
MHMPRPPQELPRKVMPLYAGEPVTGIALMEAGIAKGEATEHRFLLTKLLGWLAEIYALAGSHTDSIRCGNKALEYMKEGMHYGELIVHRALALAARCPFRKSCASILV